jgi:DnaJ family protein A protein 5
MPSSQKGGDDNDHKNKKPKCHYEILSVEQNADIGKIKKAWRTAALQWHPDKNNNSIASTEQFRLIQEAYECLSDPVERKWYDEHREGILQGYDASSDSNISFLFNVMPFQHSCCYNGYHDMDGGFYQVYNHVFHSIVEGERRGWTSEGGGNNPFNIY